MCRTARGFQVRCPCRPRRFPQRFPINAPIFPSGRVEFPAQRRQVVGLAEEVCQGEAQVEGRIAEVDHFVIEQHQAAFVYQDVFGAVIAVHQGDAAVQVSRIRDSRKAAAAGAWRAE